MAERLLGPDERALWARVTASVRALHRRAAEPPPPLPKRPPPSPPSPSVAKPPPLPAAPPRQAIGETLDGGWDRRLRGGAVAPDATIDLHGHTLATAHAALDAALAHALARGDRLLLVVTGKPRAADRREGRGAIRAAMPDWLVASPHAARIAAVRVAHPRHGGAGALYLVLRRRR